MKVIVSKDQLRVDNVSRLIGEGKSLLKAIDINHGDVFKSLESKYSSFYEKIALPDVNTCEDIDIVLDSYTKLYSFSSTNFYTVCKPIKYDEFDWNCYFSGGSALPLKYTPHHFSSDIDFSIDAIHIDDEKKSTIYAELKDISEVLNYSDHKTLRELGGVVSEGLSNFDSYHELAHLIYAAEAIISFKQIFKQNIKSAINALRRFRRQKGISLKIDLRKKIRDIMKFIFKNMDDQSGADDVLFSFFQGKHSLFDSIFYLHGFKGSYKTIRAY